MDDEVRELLEKSRYDEALKLLLDLYQKKVFGMAVMMLKDAGRAEEVRSHRPLTVNGASSAKQARVLAFSASVAIAAALTFGLLPALRGSRLAPQGGLRD